MLLITLQPCTAIFFTFLVITTYLPVPMQKREICHFWSCYSTSNLRYNISTVITNNSNITLIWKSIKSVQYKLHLTEYWQLNWLQYFTTCPFFVRNSEELILIRTATSYTVLKTHAFLIDALGMNLLPLDLFAYGRSNIGKYESMLNR